MTAGRGWRGGSGSHSYRGPVLATGAEERSGAATSEPAEPAGRPSRRWLGALAVVFGVATLFEHLRLAKVVAATAINEDVALMWYTTREWGALQVRQPNIYGQAYGWSPEALPMEAVRRIGATPWAATTYVLATIAVLGWFLLALAAWRRSRRPAALLAVLAPALLAAYYAFYVTAVPTYQGPHLVAIAGAALLLARPRRVVAEWAAWTLLGLGLLMDPSAALLGAPVAAAHLLRPGLDRRRLAVLAAGAVLPLAYLVWMRWFYEVHPDYALFGTASIVPSWSTLTDNLGRLSRYFTLLSPELAPYWTVVLVVLGLLVAVLVSTRRRRNVIPALLVPLLLAWGLATPKANLDLGDFIPPGRIFATLPHALWFLGYLVAESGALRRLRLPPAAGTVAIGTIVALAAVSVGVRQADFEGRVLRHRDEGVKIGGFGGYGFRDTAALARRCAELEAATQAIEDKLLLFGGDQAAAYGCGTVAYGRLETLVGELERRTWRLYDELGRTRSSVVLGDAGEDFCDFAEPRVTTCEPVEGGGVTMTFPPQSILAVMERLDIGVRDFGPRCEPEIIVVLECEQPLRLPVSDLVVGPPPADQPAAEALVEEAFAASLDAARGFTTLEAGTRVADAVAARPQRYQRQLGEASVDTTRIDFVSDRQARVALDVTSVDQGVKRVEGWAVLRDGSWLVARDTFCLIEFMATREQRWCSPQVP